jgi:hypothetical protein
MRAFLKKTPRLSQKFQKFSPPTHFLKIGDRSDEGLGPRVSGKDLGTG